MAAIRIFLAGVLFAMSAPGFAADRNMEYQVKAVNAVRSCEGLNRALAKAKNKDEWQDLYGYSLYTMGYVTAINRLAYNTYDIAGAKNTKTLMVWLEKYCAEHPTDKFDTALYQLIAELYPARTTIAPD